MENNNKEILIDNFLKNNTIFLLSSFVSNMLHKTLHSIEIKRSKNDTVVFCFDIQFDEKCANFLNIVHGGSIAILCDNVTNMCLYEIAKHIKNNMITGHILIFEFFISFSSFI